MSWQSESQILQKRDEIEKKLRDLENVLLIADENGLFHKQHVTEASYKFEEISKAIQDGIEELNKDNPDKKINAIKAREKYDLASHKLYKTISHTRRKWRFVYSYGAPIFMYFFGITVGVFYFWFNYSNIISTSEVLMVPIWTFLWGTMGGVLQGVWRLWHDLETQSLRRHLLSWYFILPFMGAILGAIAYLIFFAGFIVATGAGEISSEFFVMLISVLAGFSSKWMIMLLLRVAKLIQPQSERQD